MAAGLMAAAAQPNQTAARPPRRSNHWHVIINVAKGQIIAKIVKNSPGNAEKLAP
jgi:hypothetical protein